MRQKQRAHYSASIGSRAQAAANQISYRALQCSVAPLLINFSRPTHNLHIIPTLLAVTHTRIGNASRHQDAGVGLTS